MLIGIIGNGFVGKATKLLKSPTINIMVYDIRPEACEPPGTRYLQFTDNIDNLIVEDNNKYYDSINLIFENTKSKLKLRDHNEYNWQINRSFAQISCLISKKK